MNHKFKLCEGSTRGDGDTYQEEHRRLDITRGAEELAMRGGHIHYGIAKPGTK
jgi:hypothetical protein